VCADAADLSVSPHEEPSVRAPVPTAAERLGALVEVILCSDYPTQILLGSLLTVAGYSAKTAGGALSIGYVATLSLLDTVVLLSLIWLFLRAHGERPREIFLGPREVAHEFHLGFRLSFFCFILIIAVLATLQLLAPSLHTVEHNPLGDLIHPGRDALIFALVVVVAGGVREEIQRAFLLHRFEQSLGGGAFGLAVVSVGFGSGHIVQGLDAAIATGVLGAFWGVIYLRRRSAVAPMVSHAGFNLLQLAQFLLGR